MLGCHHAYNSSSTTTVVRSMIVPPHFYHTIDRTLARVMLNPHKWMCATLHHEGCNVPGPIVLLLYSCCAWQECVWQEIFEPSGHLLTAKRMDCFHRKWEKMIKQNVKSRWRSVCPRISPTHTSRALWGPRACVWIFATEYKCRQSGTRYRGMTVAPRTTAWTATWCVRYSTEITTVLL